MEDSGEVPPSIVSTILTSFGVPDWQSLTRLLEISGCTIFSPDLVSGCNPLASPFALGANACTLPVCLRITNDQTCTVMRWTTDDARVIRLTLVTPTSLGCWILKLYNKVPDSRQKRPATDDGNAPFPKVMRLT